MLITSRPSWAISETEATPEDVYINRREWLCTTGFAGLGFMGAASCIGGFASTVVAAIGGYPAMRNNAYVLDRDLTPEKEATTYTNFYEFGSSKVIWRDAQKLVTDPWIVTIDGLVETEMQVDADDLIAKIHQAKGHFFKELLKDGISCRLGVAECVKACLQNGVKIGFITTTTRENISVLQEALKSQIDFSDFDLVTTKGDVVREKPDGEVYHLALERFGIPTEDVVAVEDTEVNQEAALQAGLLCYLFAGEYATTGHNLNAVRSLQLIADNVAQDAS